jgi:DNA-binding GntR family transcriptional regulator
VERVTLERIEREKSRLADDVYERLTAAILDGRIRPGDRLIQDKLADDLKVSRTPVREALLRLEKEGAVELAPVRGYVVTAPTGEVLTQIHQAREAVEVYAARLVAEAGPEALEHVTNAAASANPTPASIVDSFNANRRLHRSVVEASGNRVLCELFDAVWNRTTAVRLFAELYVEEHTLSQNVTAMHDEVLQALASGDPDVAAKAMTVHIRQGKASHRRV